MNIKDWFDRHEEPIDIEDASDIEIIIRNDGKTLWVNAPACIVRMCRIHGEIKIIDNRKKRRNGKS